MARFIIREKVYDTDKMKLIGHVKKWYEFQGWLSKQVFGDGMGRMNDCELYRSDKGNYLLVHKNDCGSTMGEAIEKAEAKGLLMRYDYDSYAELFGELEEA